MNTTVTLPCGRLSVSIHQARWPLEALCGFACRRNRKRGFLFVSKVLGKHIPVRPALMRQSHHDLTLLLPELPGPVLFVALAETATALGQGLFEHWLRHTGRGDALFLHTTRYRLRRPLALTFDESHSHAPEHLLYRPVAPEDAKLFHSARTLVLIDDEISTGATLVNLARACLRLNPSLASVHLVCLTDWSGEARRTEIQRHLERPVAFHCLLRGEYRFEADPEFDPGPLPDVIGRDDFKDHLLPAEGGRLGLRRPAEPSWSVSPGSNNQQADAAPLAGSRVLVLGTGEFAYPPYLLARQLETRGLEVWYQSTTRSPILPGGAIESVLEFADNYGDGMPNYVYNVRPGAYDRVLIGYETWPLPADHRLAELLSAQVLVAR